MPSGIPSSPSGESTSGYPGYTHSEEIEFGDARSSYLRTVECEYGPGCDDEWSDQERCATCPAWLCKAHTITVEGTQYCPDCAPPQSVAAQSEKPVLDARVEAA